MNPTPRGLSWLGSNSARAVATMISILALFLAGYVGWRQQQYISCIADRQHAQDTRTAAISKATDAERRAQRALIANVEPGDARKLREAVVAFYDATDKVRAENPAPAPGGC